MKLRPDNKPTPPPEPPHVEVSVPKGSATMRKGDRVDVNVRVSGLKGLSRPTSLRFENRSKGIVRVAGGDVQNARILPRHVDVNGVASVNFRVTALRAGSFSISAWLGRAFFAHLEIITEKWSSEGHGESDSTKWLGDGHSIPETKEDVGSKHDYEISKKWLGSGHNSARTRYDENFKEDEWAGKDPHHFEESKKWREWSHETEDTKHDVRYHAFDESAKDESLGHWSERSLIWKKNAHRFEISREWMGDDHRYFASWAQRADPDAPIGKFYAHKWDETRKWDGDGHSYKVSKIWWQNPNHSDTDTAGGKRRDHDYTKSKKEVADGRETWTRDNHDEESSKIWLRIGHDYKVSSDYVATWPKESHHYFKASMNWLIDGHVMAKSLKKPNDDPVPMHSDYDSIDWSGWDHKISESIENSPHKKK